MERLDAVIEDLGASPILGQSVRKCLEAQRQQVLKYRGMAMLMLSDDDLPSFEGDDLFKTYDGSNHRFADLLVPLSERVQNPIIFWLSRSNPAGATYLLESDPRKHHIIQLGKPYSFEEVLFCLARALKFEGVHVTQPWFIQDIERTTRKKFEELDPICLEVFYEIEPSLKNLLASKAGELRAGKINWFIYEENHPPDLHAVGAILRPNLYAVCRTDARRTVLHRRGGEEESETSFDEFVAKYMNPLVMWLLLDISDTHWGRHWIPLLRSLIESQSPSGGLIVFINAAVVNDAFFKEFVDEENVIARI